MADAALSASHVTFRLGQRALVEGVTLDVRAGEVLGIIGPNGAGKSTLLRMMAGLLRPASGEVTLLGRGMAGWSGRDRARRLGYLPQHFAPHWDYTVRELLRLGLERGGVMSNEAALAESHGIAAVLPRCWSSLSGGERGRVLAASVLAVSPAVVLADEATAALDVGQALALMHRLRQASQDGAAVAVVVHDLNLALRWCDRIALLHEGRLRAVGTPAVITGSSDLDQVFGVNFLRLGAGDATLLLPQPRPNRSPVSRTIP